MVSLEGVSLHFGGQRIFDGINLLIAPKDRIGLVGKNGAGKSTLLKMIVGEQNVDQGQVVVPDGLSIGYLPQQLAYNDTRTVLEEAATAFEEIKLLVQDIEQMNQELAERTDYESKSYMQLVELVSEKTDRLQIVNSAGAEASLEQTLIGLGFKRTDFQRPTKEFSGGWRMRIELAKILLRSPDLFLLDEPTNHLDIESIQWLEDFLSKYPGSVVLISHDRAFLDKVCKRTVEISLGKLHDYKVPYSKYVSLRAERKEQQLAAYKNQQKQIEETQDFIERFRYKATKAVQVQSRIKQLEKMEIIEVDEEDLSAMNIKFPPAPRSGTIVFESKELDKAYGDLQVLKGIDLIIERGEKVAFVGKNGEGKTTLSRIIVGELEAQGEYKLGHNVELGYFAQNQEELLDGNKTVFETIDDVAVGDVRTKIRDILGAFLFRGEEVDKKVRVLSGGEKSRLSMAKLLLEPYNLLVLDEPTNHLDMRSKDILKQALAAYDGTLVLVSHDREFLDGLAAKIYEFRDQNIKEFRGGIYDFLLKKNIENLDALNKGNSNQVEENPKADSQNKLDYLQRKELDKQIRKAENTVLKLEEEIQELEKGIAEKEQVLAQGENMETSFFAEYEKLKLDLDTLLASWEQAQEDLEAIRAKRS